MKNKQFDFLELMAFGTFLLTLLTFIFMNVSNILLYIEKTPS